MKASSTLTALFSLVLIFGSLTLFSGYSDIVWAGGAYYDAYNNNSPVDLIDRYPYTLVKYDTNQYFDIPTNETIDTVVNVDGQPHHLRYYQGWWFDYESGTGFPARVQ